MKRFMNGAAMTSSEKANIPIESQTKMPSPTGPLAAESPSPSPSSTTPPTRNRPGDSASRIDALAPDADFGEAT